MNKIAQLALSAALIAGSSTAFGVTQCALEGKVCDIPGGKETTVMLGHYAQGAIPAKFVSTQAKKEIMCTVEAFGGNDPRDETGYTGDLICIYE
jgi:hypothetical protein